MRIWWGVVVVGTLACSSELGQIRYPAGIRAATCDLDFKPGGD